MTGMAEGVGFEPTMGYEPIAVFKTAALGHYASPPVAPSLAKAQARPRIHPARRAHPTRRSEGGPVAQGDTQRGHGEAERLSTSYPLPRHPNTSVTKNFR